MTDRHDVEPPEGGWADDGWEASLTQQQPTVADDQRSAPPTRVTPATIPPELGATDEPRSDPRAGAPVAEAGHDGGWSLEDRLLDGEVVAASGPNPIQRVRDARRRSAEGRYLKRQRRWETQRYAVPYDVSGPKVTAGVLWFAVLMGSLRYGSWLALVTLVATAAIAGLQTGFAWSQHELSDRRMAAAAALVVAAAGFGQRLGLGLVLVIATLGLAAYAVATVGADARGTRFAEVLIRSSLPAGLAAGSLVALRVDDAGAFLVVVALVSAYEVGDFLIGSGAPNAIEGPIAGLIGMAVVGYAFTVFPPDPFSSASMPAFIVLAMLGAVLGPFAASAILPRGIAWSPALRRLDSHLFVAPLFLVLT